MPAAGDVVLLGMQAKQLCDYHPNGRVNLPVRPRTMSNDWLQVIVGTPMRDHGFSTTQRVLIQTNWRDVDGH